MQRHGVTFNFGSAIFATSFLYDKEIWFAASWHSTGHRSKVKDVRSK